VLGLAEQVGGGELAVAADLVGDHQRLGRAGEQIDAHPAEELALGLRHEGVAGSDEDIDRRDRLGAQRHRADRLDAAQRIDVVSACQHLRRDDRRRGLTAERRGAGDHPRHAGHLGGDHAHMGGGQQRIFAAGHIAAGRVQRDVAMPQHDAGQCLHLDVRHARALDPGEVAHLRLREFDILEILRRKLVEAVLLLPRCQGVAFAVPAVEFHAQLAHRGVAARLDVG
jgi:hypothetical protein